MDASTVEIQRRIVRRNNQLLVMLGATNLFFITCTMPYCITQHIAFSIDDKIFDIILVIIHILAYSNNAFNFVFFIIFSQKYRETLIKLIKPFKVNKSSPRKLNRNKTIRQPIRIKTVMTTPGELVKTNEQNEKIQNENDLELKIFR